MIRSGFKRIVLSLAAICGLALPAAAQLPPTETLVPTTTQYWLSIPAVDEAVKEWNKTELGKLMDDPIMKPVRDDLDRQTKTRREEQGNDLGIDWDDLKSIAGGELCLTLIHPASRRPSRNILADVTGRAKEAAAVRAKLHATQTRQKAVHSTLKVGDVTINVFKKDDKTRLAEFLHGHLFCIARDETVATEILTRHLKGGGGGESLAGFAPFVMVNKRVAADNALLGKTGKKTPHVRWFVQPIGFAEARRQLDPQRDPEALDMLDVAKKVGFQGVQGMGGVAHLREEAYDLLNRAAVYAPKPWEKSLNMLSLVNDENARLAAEGEWWIPKQLASFSVSNLELLTAFDHFGPFFDEAVVGGKRDAFKKAIRRIKSDPLGPKVDIREEIVRRLVAKGPSDRETARCILIADNRLPVEPDSERQIIAVQIPNPDDEGKLVKALTRYFKPDKTATFRPKWAGPYNIWDLEPEPKKDDKKKPPALKVVGGGGPAVALPAPAPRRASTRPCAWPRAISSTPRT